MHFSPSRLKMSHCRSFLKTVSFSTSKTSSASVMMFNISAVKCGKVIPVVTKKRKITLKGRKDKSIIYLHLPDLWSVQSIVISFGITIFTEPAMIPFDEDITPSFHGVVSSRQQTTFNASFTLAWPLVITTSL